MYYLVPSNLSLGLELLVLLVRSPQQLIHTLLLPAPFFSGQATKFGSPKVLGRCIINRPRCDVASRCIGV